MLTVFAVDILFPELSFSFAAADVRDLDDSVDFEYNRSKTESEVDMSKIYLTRTVCCRAGKKNPMLIYL